jgi:hypothetical protein
MARPKITGRKIGAVANSENAPDELVPDRQICREFGITPMTLWRWDRDPELRFAPPVRIRNRKFRSRRAIEVFKARMLRRAIERRARDDAARVASRHAHPPESRFQRDIPKGEVA